MSHSKDEIISESSAMRDALAKLQNRALDKLPVFLVGERGVGKRRLARWLYQRSPEARTNLVVCQLSDEPEDVCLEALSTKIHQASDGALFIDEIEDLPTKAQSKVLDALHTHRIRLIASASGAREDIIKKELLPELVTALGEPIHIPALRERKEDIPALVASFLVEAGLPGDAIGPLAMEAFLHYSWPENVRELKHTIIRAIHANGGVKLKLEHLPAKFHKS